MITRNINSSGRGVTSNVDWVAVLLYFALIAFGWVNIYAATNSGSAESAFAITERYGMQLIWIGEPINALSEYTRICSSSVY